MTRKKKNQSHDPCAQSNSPQANPSNQKSSQNGSNSSASGLVHRSAGPITAEEQASIRALDVALGVPVSDAVLGETENVQQREIKVAGTVTRNPRTVERNLEPNSAWTSLFSGSRLTAKGQPLKFVAPISKNGHKIAQLDKVEVQKLSEFWENAVVMYVIGDTPTIAAVHRFIAHQWNQVTKPHIYLHDEGYFVITFASQEDRNEIVYGGPYTFAGKPMILKPWTANFDFHAEMLKVIPLWVKLPNLPLNCWSSDSLSRIGSTLGVPLFADECTTKQLRVSFARLLVEIDVTQPLPSLIYVEDPNGKLLEQHVAYDWKPHFCKSSNQVGMTALRNNDRAKLKKLEW